MVQTTLFEQPPAALVAKTAKAANAVAVKAPKAPVGRTFLTDTGVYYNVGKITSSTILKHSINPYYTIKKGSITNQVFVGPPKYEIFNPANEKDEVLSLVATKMFEGLVDWETRSPANLYQYIQMAFSDMFDGGASIFEPVWVNVNGWQILYSLKHLPWDTFVDLPDSYKESPSSMLKGVVMNEQGILEYYQLQDDALFHQIPNALHIKSPMSRDMAGDPLCLPIISIIDMLNFLWDIARMKAARVGAPSVMVEVLADDEETLAQATDIITNWGVRTQFSHNEFIRVYDLGISNDNGIEGTIDAAEQILDSVYNPAAQLSDKGTTRIGGSDNAAERMLYNQANTFLSWLELGFSTLVQRWLDINYFVGYSGKVVLPKLEIDKTVINLQKANDGYADKSITLDERRELRGLSVADDEIRAKLEEEYGGSDTLLTTDPSSPLLTGGTEEEQQKGDGTEEVTDEEEVKEEDVKEEKKGKKGGAIKNTALKPRPLFEALDDQTEKDLFKAEDAYSKAVYKALGVVVDES